MMSLRSFLALGLSGLLLAAMIAAPPVLRTSSPTVAVAAQELPKKVRVATYNIEHFGGKPNGADRIDRLKAVIEKLDADVIGLQEIKDRAALRLIFPADRWQILIDDDSKDGQDLAVAVRLPFKIAGSNGNDIDATDKDFLYPVDDRAHDDPFPSNRDVLVARIAVPGTDVNFVIMVHHAKARVGGRRNTDRRRKQAAELIVHAIQTHFDGDHVVLLGDMNDNPDDESINILETGDPNAAAGPDDVSDDTFMVNLTQPLAALDHVSWGLHEGMPIVGGKRDTRVAGSRSQNNTTRNGDGVSAPILFDQILITRSAFEQFVVRQVMVFDDPIAQKGRLPGGRAVAINYASDHTPVVAEFLPSKPDGLPIIPIPAPIGPATPVLTPPPPPTGTAPLTKVRIVELLPNPEGPNAGKETVTLKNFGNADADVTGWRLMDRAGNDLKLRGVIKTGDSLVVKLKGGQVPLNNSGDEVRLLDDDGVLQDRVRYSGAEAKAGVAIKFVN